MADHAPQRRQTGVDRRGFLIGAGSATAAGPAYALGWSGGLGPVDSILVEKAKRRLTLLRGQAELASFRVALGRGYGPKLHEGDGRTPEGSYYLSGFNAQSEFYRSIRISYPNDEDRQRAAVAGRHPGGLIMIHGLDPAIEAQWRDQHWMFNWTNGCVALTNAEMDLLWDSVDVGTPVDIRP